MDEVENAKDLLKGLIERMGVEVEIEGRLRDGCIWLEVTGDMEGILIGKHGRTLEALQVIVSRMTCKGAKNPARIVVDVGQYRQRREESLAKLANRMGEKVKREGKTVTMGPFNAHDRRIIHMALQDDQHVKTESIGEGPLKKIAILPGIRIGEEPEPLE